MDNQSTLPLFPEPVHEVAESEFEQAEPTIISDEGITDVQLVPSPAAEPDGDREQAGDVILPGEVAEGQRYTLRDVETASVAITVIPPERFDYGTLPAGIAKEMRQAADRVRHHVKAAWIDVGRELTVFKDQIDHGKFVEWVECACGMNIRSAQRAMQAAELVTKNDKLSYLPPDGLLALSAKSVPEPIVHSIIERIEAGEQPTAAEIKRNIDNERWALKKDRILAKSAEKRTPLQQKFVRQLKADALQEQRDEQRRSNAATVAEILVGGRAMSDRQDEVRRLLDGLNDSDLGRAIRARALAMHISGETDVAVTPATASQGSGATSIETMPVTHCTPGPDVVPAMLAAIEAAALPSA